MKKLSLLVFLLTALSQRAQNADSIAIRKVYDHFLTKGNCYSNLEYLSTKIGGRLSGSRQASLAVEWAKKAMYEAGADTVILQPCMVPHWERGKKEQRTLKQAGKKPLSLNCTALGSSVGTGTRGIEAPVVEVRSFEELEKLGEKRSWERSFFTTYSSTAKTSGLAHRTDKP